MSNSIHRVTVNVEDYQELELTGPPISVAASRDGGSDTFDLWFEHMDDCRQHPYAMLVFGTGHPVPWSRHSRHGYRFLGTVVTPSGLVWHVYTGHRKGEAIGL